MSTESNKALVRRFIDEVQSGHDVDAIHRFMSSDFVNYAESPGLPNDLNSVKHFLEKFFAAFPDVNVTIHSQVAEGDKVVTHKTFHGTHQGDFMGIAPTGNKIAFEAIEILTVAGDMITEHWAVGDNLGLMKQLGAF